MSATTKTLPDIIKDLPPAEQKAVRDFAEFLATKHQQKAIKKLRQNWVGILRDYREQYTSLDLQKKALEWRNEA